MIYRLSGLKGNLKNSQCLPSEAVLTLPSTLDKHLLCPGLGSSVLLDLAFVLRGNLSSCAFHPLGLVSQSFEKVKDYLPLAVCDDYTSNQPRTDGHFTYQTPRGACHSLTLSPQHIVYNSLQPPLASSTPPPFAVWAMHQNISMPQSLLEIKNLASQPQTY